MRPLILRSMPVVERVLIAVILLMVVVVLAFLLAWHLRWRGILDRAAAAPPHPGVMIPIAIPVPPDVERDFKAWCAESRKITDGTSKHTYIVSDVGDFVLASPLVHGQAAHAGGNWALDPRFHDLDPGMCTIAPLENGRADRLADLLARGLRLSQLTRLPGVVDDHRSAPDSYRGWDLDFDPCVRAAAAWRAAGPDSANCSLANLDHLDALVGALGPDRRLHDGDGQIRSIRDAAYLDAQLAGALPPERLARWRAGADAIEPLLVDLEIARRWTIPDIHATVFAMNPWYYGDPERGGRLLWLGRWWDMPSSCAQECAGLDHNLDEMIANAPSPAQIDCYRLPCLPTLTRHRFALIASAIAESWMHADAHCDLDLGPSRIGASLTLSQVAPNQWVIAIGSSQVPPVGSLWTELNRVPLDVAITTLPAEKSGPAFVWSISSMMVRLPTPLPAHAAPFSSATAPVPTE